VTFLRTHHEGQDLLLWPRLLERGPVEIDPLIETTKAHPAGLANALDDRRAKAVAWRNTAAVQERDALVTASATRADCEVSSVAAGYEPLTTR
jgi:hypothetical protein